MPIYHISPEARERNIAIQLQKNREKEAADRQSRADYDQVVRLKAALQKNNIEVNSVFGPYSKTVGRTGFYANRLQVLQDRARTRAPQLLQ